VAGQRNRGDTVEPQAGGAPNPDEAGKLRTDEQSKLLPGAWQRADRAIVRATEAALFAVGVLFTIMITLEVISRYVFNFSIYFVNAAARLLLIWFFLLGAGIALRHGAHVGFELLLSALTAERRRLVVFGGLCVTGVFYLEMIWAGIHSLGPAMRQSEPGLDISLAWPILAIPVGFALLLYHLLVIMWVELRREQPSDA
jgi:TRAP-type C4-dicarboxylate transport system permease small subunit